MKLLAVVARLFKEQAREAWVAILTFSFGPLIVLIYFALTGGTSTVYSLQVRNLDPSPQGDRFVQALQSLAYQDGSPMLRVLPGSKDRGADGTREAEEKIKSRSLDALLLIPDNFGAAFDAYLAGRSEPSCVLAVKRDFGNFRSTLPAILVASTLDSELRSAGGGRQSIAFADEAIGASGTRTEFESYVPGLFVFAVILLIFQSSMVVSRETEKLTLRRMALSRMTTFDFLGGVTVFELAMGMVSVGCTLGTAILCGFTSEGPLAAVFCVAAVASLSIIGMGLMLSAFAKTALQAFVLANLPLGILMFLSGAMVPMPKIAVARAAGIDIGLFDFLPTTHAVTAINKIVSMSAGFGDLGYELSSLVILSALYFLAGLFLFHRLRMRNPA
jgi:ABC-2 type transport system permease protein